MGVNYRYPGTLIIGVIIVAAVCLAVFLLKKTKKRRPSLRAANTGRLKSNPLYKKTLLQARVYRIVSIAGIILSLIAALCLTARPYRRESVKESVTRRDIFLCVDLSSSNYAGVQSLVDEFKKTVDGLDGDRIGISVFNTSSSRYVPMTDDYSFVLERLDALSEYLAAESEFMTAYANQYDSVYDIPESERSRYEELNKILSSFDDGITAGYEIKGTSAVGEGLASCLFSFPELTKEDRTRTIIFLTDNHEELVDESLVTLEEAAQMCTNDKVTVFGIYPGGGQGAGETQSSDTASEMSRMKSSVESTGGRFYESGSSLTASEILADINSRELQNTNTVTATLDKDVPFFWFCVLIAGFLILAGSCLYFMLRRGIRKGLFSRKLTAGILLFAMAVGLIVIGIRPMYLSPSAEIMTNNLDVAFVVDTTISMWAEDHGGGTRIDGVKKDILSIMNALPGSSFSVIRFDNGSEIMTPFTQDIESIYDILAELDMPAYTTAQGSSLNTAFEALQTMLVNAGNKDSQRRRIVFVFSDGETTDGSELMSFSDLSGMIDEGAVLGYGTKDGGRMYYPGRGYVKDSTTGTDAMSRIDESALRQIADDLRIGYINETDSLIEADDLNLQLRTRLNSIRKMSRKTAFKEGDKTGYNETYYYFSGFIVFLLLIWMSLTIYRGSVA